MGRVVCFAFSAVLGSVQLCESRSLARGTKSEVNHFSVVESLCQGCTLIQHLFASNGFQVAGCPSSLDRPGQSGPRRQPLPALVGCPR